MADKPIIVPSEILEPIVSKLLVELTQCIGMQSPVRDEPDWFSKENMIREMDGIQALVERLGATHCALATQNFIDRLKGLSTDTIVAINRKM